MHKRAQPSSEEDIDAAAKRLMDEVLLFRKKIGLKTVDAGPLYLTEAAELCTVGPTGNVISSILSLQEQGDRKDQIDWLDKHKSVVIVLAAILMIPLIYYMIITHV